MRLLVLLFCSIAAIGQSASPTPETKSENSAPTVDSVCLSEILISTPQPYDPPQIAAAQRKAESAREAIRQGAKFEDTAKKYSDGPSAGLGGALGLFKRGQLAKSIEDKVFPMKVGDLSDVIRTKQGFTILKVGECGPAPESQLQAKTNSPDQKSRPDFGLGIGAGGRPLGQVDILSDTRGVDFGPYLQGVVATVRKNWFMLIPESAQWKKAKLAIEFAITKDGQVADMRLVTSSGDVALDRPAWGSITNSNPFKPLPTEFKGPYLALRFRYFYNPDKSDPESGGPSRSSKGNTGAGPTESKSGIVVSISAPGSLQVPAGGSQVVTATVTGSEEKAVEWTITGSSCSGSACGKMVGDLYIAPSAVPTLPGVTLTASSKADPTAKASVTVHIVRPH